MGNKVTDELLSTVRSVVGAEYSDMDIIRALHMANSDATAAVNIIFDSPDLGTRGRREMARNSPAGNTMSSSATAAPAYPKVTRQRPSDSQNRSTSLDSNAGNGDVNAARGSSVNVVQEGVDHSPGSSGSEWWFLGRGEVSGLSTCKGRKVILGEEVVFTFPPKNKSSSPSPGRVIGRGRHHVKACSDIMRFSTKDSGEEIGRIPNEWARCLLPLVRDKKVRIEGFCKSFPQVLSIMDTIVLSVRVYINSTMFHKRHHISLKAASNSTEESTVHPLPNLFRLLGLTPFRKAQFTPGDFYTRKRPFNSKDISGIPLSLLHANGTKNLDVSGNKVDNKEPISDTDLENIVGVGNCSDLQEMEPSENLQCELRPYQKQALFWMTQLERGHCLDEATATLHPCWDAYHLADMRGLDVYLNAFSGDATTEFPSTLEMARGGGIKHGFEHLVSKGTFGGSLDNWQNNL